MDAVTPTITDEDIASSRRDGHLFPIRALSAARAGEYRSELEAFEERWRDDPTLHEPIENYLRANLHVVSRAAARLAGDPAIVDIAARFLGDDVMCWMAELIVKEPGSAKMLSMHQDLTYWGLDAGDDLVTVWIALTDATVENGAMRFVTGSHRQGQIEHRDTYGADNLLSRGQEVAVAYDPSLEVAVELDAGEVSVHHGLTVHGSGPNITDARRVALVVRYVNPNVASRHGRDYAMLVRGANRSANLITTAPPLTDCDESSLRLHREISQSQMQSLARNANEDRFGYARDR